MVQKLSKSNQSVEKTMRIVEILAQANAPMRLSDLAREAELPPSTALRMVNTLVGCGYAYQEEKGSMGYGLTMRFLTIGQQVADHFSIRGLAHPYLIEMANEIGETCCLAVKERDVVRYMDVVEDSRSIMRIRQRIGDAVPMHCTSTGKLYLTQYSPEKLDAFIAQGLQRKTQRTLTTESALKFELQETAKRGYAVDDEECEDGMYCVAMPIRDANGTIFATVCVSGPIYRMTRDRITHQILPTLRKYTGAISNMINGDKQEKGDGEFIEMMKQTGN